MNLRDAGLLQALTLALTACAGEHQAASPAASPCDVYCTLATMRCKGAALIYNSTDACLTACAGFPATGALGDARGNTVQCRITYLVASETPSLPYCLDAGPDGGETCK